ncbi:MULTISPECIES: MFS transporter [Tsukamurella]|uniref:MFS transporter n=2 Tax=Tsukamurella TaxID=2060 RepID=A0A5C5S5Y1_9ACTN|nr:MULTISPECIES: MFS transporter [Tsukamurella]NMD55439.1 MFS transporter [Tsukamurella columbiensis]TWS30609.1 MFS transporter [Tsukamurella conjunctivitidis]
MTKLLALLGFSMMPMIDATIVNVAAPSIARDLPATPTQLQFVVGGYLLAYGSLIITGSRLGARYGHVRTLGWATAAFVLASVVCGLAPNAVVLIAARIAQGVTAAAIMPQVMSLIQRDYAGPALARALSMFSLTTAAGFILGQVGGGLLVALDVAGLGWRLVFLVNLPIGAALLIALRRYFAADDGDPQTRMDLGGVVVGAAALLLLIAPLTFGRDVGWAPWVIGLLVLAVPALGAFAWVERAVARRGGNPLVPSDLVRSPGFLAAIGVVLLVFANYAGFLFATTLFLQNEHGYGPLGSGLWFLVFTPGFLAVTVGWKRLPPRLLGPLVAVGAALVVAGDLLLWWAAQSPSVGVVFALALLILGAGTGAMFGPILTLALRSVAPALAPAASGVVTTMFQVGSAVGVAVIGSLYFAAGGLATAALWCAVLAGIAGVLVVVTTMRSRSDAGDGSR